MELSQRVQRFLLVGALTVLIDFVVYRTLLYLGFPFASSKLMSFIAGAAFAYFANKHYTFAQPVAAHRITKSALRFSAVYLANMLVNVGINEALLYLQPEWIGRILFAFLVATAASATSNFIGMELFVFPTVRPVHRARY